MTLAAVVSRSRIIRLRPAFAGTTVYELARCAPSCGMLRSAVADLRLGFALAGQPFIQPAHVDDHALMGAAADLLQLVAGGDVERDAAAVDTGDLGFGRHLVPDRRRRQMADVDGGADRALAGIEIAADGIE